MASFARQAYFAVTAFKFLNRDGASRFGRFRIRPVAGIELLGADQAAKKATDYLDVELSKRLSTGTFWLIRFAVGISDGI